VQTLSSRSIAVVAISFLLFAMMPGEAAAQCQSSTSVEADCYKGKYVGTPQSARAWALLQSKKYKEAVEAYTRLIGANPANATYYNNRADALDSLGEKKRAIEDYTSAIKLDSRRELYYANRGGVYFDLQEFSFAIQDFEKALSLNPKYWLVRRQLARALAEAGRNEAAIEVIADLYKRNPKDNNVLLYRAVFLRNMGKLTEATAELKCERFDLAIRSGCFALRADIYQTGADLDRASADVNMALRLNAKNDYAYLVRGEIRSKQGDDLAAVLDYTKAFELDPNDVRSLLRRGDVLLRIGRETDALKDYDRAASLERKNFRELAFRKEAGEKADKIRRASLAKRAKSPIMIFFDYGLTDVVKSAEPLIEIAAEIVLKGHATAVQVTGHADVVERADNPEIATARAFAIRSALIRAGVPADKVKTAKGSPNEALIPDVKGEKEPQNRRVVLTFMQ
jgi:tetratricopeptide (TPR) repeat protein